MYIRLFFSHHAQLSPQVTFHNQPLSQLLNFFCLFLRLFFLSVSLIFYSVTLYPRSFFCCNLSVHKSLWSVCLLNFIFFPSLSPFFVIFSLRFMSFSPFYRVILFLSLHVTPRCFLAVCLLLPPFFISPFMPLHSHHVSSLRLAPLVCVCLHVHVIGCVPKLYKSGILRKLKRALKFFCDRWKMKSMLVRK